MNKFHTTKNNCYNTPRSICQVLITHCLQDLFETDQKKKRKEKYEYEFFSKQFFFMNAVLSKQLHVEHKSLVKTQLSQISFANLSNSRN
jgi:hypothetical protein